MPNTGYLYSLSQTSEDNGFVDPWANPENVGQVSGESTSFFDKVVASDRLWASDYGNPIVEESSVIGVEIEVIRYASVIGVVDNTIRLRIGGTFSLNMAKVPDWGTSSEVIIYGGPTNTAGLVGLTEASLALLTVEIIANSEIKEEVTAFVSSIRANFYYRPPSTDSRRRRQSQAGGVL